MSNQIQRKRTIAKTRFLNNKNKGQEEKKANSKRICETTTIIVKSNWTYFEDERERTISENKRTDTTEQQKQQKLQQKLSKKKKGQISVTDQRKMKMKNSGKNFRHKKENHLWNKKVNHPEIKTNIKDPYHHGWVVVAPKAHRAAIAAGKNRPIACDAGRPTQVSVGPSRLRDR